MIRHIVTGGIGPGESGVGYIVTRGLRSKRLVELIGADTIASMGRATMTSRTMGRQTQTSASMGRATTTTGGQH